MRGFILVIMFFLLGSCQLQEADIQGHWFMTDYHSPSTSMYLEFEYYEGNSRILLDGLTWVESNISIYSLDSINFNGFLGRISVSNDSLRIFNDTSSYFFKRIDSKLSGITDSDLDAIRKFKFYVNTTSYPDSSRYNEANSKLWYYFRGVPAIDSLDFFEDIEIVPKHEVK